MVLVFALYNSFLLAFRESSDNEIYFAGKRLLVKLITAHDLAGRLNSWKRARDSCSNPAASRALT